MPIQTPRQKPPPSRYRRADVQAPGYAEIYSRAREHSHTSDQIQNTQWGPQVPQTDAEGRPDLERPSTAPARTLSPSRMAGNEGVWYGTGQHYVPIYRQRKARPLPAQDAAGLLGGERFHGRVNPQLGHGQPPPEQYDDARTVAEHHKTWHPQHSHLLQKRDIMGQAGFSGVPPDSARPSKRTFADPIAKSYHLHGTGVQVDSQMPAMRKSRGWGTRPRYTLVNTSARILGTGAGLTADDVDPSGNFGGHHKMFGRKVEVAHPRDHPDVLQYRYSKGICPQAYKLDARRTPAPQVSPKVGEFLSKAYYDSHQNYQLNRAHAEGTTEVLFHHEQFAPSRLQYK